MVGTLSRRAPGHQALSDFVDSCLQFGIGILAPELLRHLGRRLQSERYLLLRRDPRDVLLFLGDWIEDAAAEVPQQ
jgi:hypothetical protein